MNEASAGSAAIEESWHSLKGRAVREVVLGMHDGLITTIGFLSGVNAAHANIRVIIILGLAEAFA
jgi:VIT1/CCC1 family predicted Fe2+/Mn2+ transporter